MNARTVSDYLRCRRVNFMILKCPIISMWSPAPTVDFAAERGEYVICTSILAILIIYTRANLLACPSRAWIGVICHRIATRNITLSRRNSAFRIEQAVTNHDEHIQLGLTSMSPSSRATQSFRVYKILNWTSLCSGEIKLTQLYSNVTATFQKQSELSITIRRIRCASCPKKKTQILKWQNTHLIIHMGI